MVALASGTRPCWKGLLVLPMNYPEKKKKNAELSLVCDHGRDGSGTRPWLHTSNSLARLSLSEPPHVGFLAGWSLCLTPPVQATLSTFLSPVDIALLPPEARAHLLHHGLGALRSFHCELLETLKHTLTFPLASQKSFLIGPMLQLLCITHSWNSLWGLKVQWHFCNYICDHGSSQ